ncbi:hypothetical protein AX15_005662 [Amanita polypyramis BW_CC]|nr:hypothetical protein AX15_005662 [Amanita polypyramis BW_CC]
MNSRKRSAQEPLLPIRSAKQPRVAPCRLDGDPASPSEYQGILSRWLALGQDFFKLSVETVFYIIPVSVKAPPRYLLPPQLSLQRRTFNSLQMTLQSTSSNVGAQSSPGDVVSPTSTPPNGNPSSLTNLSHPTQNENVRPPTSNAANAAVSMQRENRDSSLEKSGTTVVDTDVVCNNNRYARINQTLERLSLVSGSEIPASKRRFREREHIYAHTHRRRVLEDRKRLQEELRKELYKTKRRSGEQDPLLGLDMKLRKAKASPPVTLISRVCYLEYQALLQRLGKDSNRLSSQSLNDLRAKPTESLRVRRYSVSGEDDTAFLQRALANAKATLNSPKPPEPFTPSLEQRRLVNRLKDEELDARFRPKLPTCLLPEDEAKVNVLLRKQGVISKLSREQVTDQDLSRLRPRQWLNDEIINFYGALILARSESCKENPGNDTVRGKKLPLNVHYFSTFFWSKLRSEGYEKGRLAKWTKKVDLFSKDVALIPVNHNNAHWTCAAINFRKKRIESYDSMGMAKDEVFKHLRSYLDAEHRNKKKRSFDFSSWENYAPDSTPQQENGYDCGVFTCQFLEALSRGEESFIFTQKDMSYIRRRMIWEIGHTTLRDD